MRMALLAKSVLLFAEGSRKRRVSACAKRRPHPPPFQKAQSRSTYRQIMRGARHKPRPGGRVREGQTPNRNELTGRFGVSRHFCVPDNRVQFMQSFRLFIVVSFV